MYGRESTVNRLRRAADVYGDVWRKYVSAVSKPRWRIGSEGSVIIGREMFVHFLLLVNEPELAVSVTEAMITNLMSELSDQPLDAVFPKIAP